MSAETLPSTLGLPDRGGPRQPLIDARDLTCHFPVRGGAMGPKRVVRAVDGVSFSIAKGETLGVVGEFWLRQVDDGAASDRAHSADGGVDPLRRAGAGRGPVAARTPARGADGVSGQLRVAEPAPDD